MRAASLSIAVASGCLVACLAWSSAFAHSPPKGSTVPNRVEEAPKAERPPAGPRFGRWVRGGTRYRKNHETVKAAFRETATRAAAATVWIRADDQDVALGTVVDAAGYILTKASLLRGKVTCRLDDGQVLEAETVGVNREHDLALLQVADNAAASAGWTPVAWRSGDVPAPGSLVASVGPKGALFAVGVIGAEPRTIAGSTHPESRRGWLGISVGMAGAGPNVSGIVAGSAAERAGLQTGDQVLRINGTAMTSVDHVVQTVGNNAADETIKLLIQRGEEELEVVATLGKPPSRKAPQDHWGGGPFSDRRWGFPTVLPHDAALKPNRCGGPLVDTDGNVVGINIARALRVSTYAIPAKVAQEVLDELR